MASSASGPMARLCQSVTPAVFASLRRQGYAVVDGAVGAQWTTALRDDIARLNTSGRLRLNSTHLVTNSGAATQYLEKSNVWEAEGADPAVQADCSALAAMANDTALVDRLNELGMASAGGGGGGSGWEGADGAVAAGGGSGRHRLARHTMKVQFNAGGGGCFPYHFDTDPALDTRRLTAILYLNDSRWDASRNGGQLVSRRCSL
jgi:hypothetical protein